MGSMCLFFKRIFIQKFPFRTLLLRVKYLGILHCTVHTLPKSILLSKYSILMEFCHSVDSTFTFCSRQIVHSPLVTQCLKISQKNCWGFFVVIFKHCVVLLIFVEVFFFYFQAKNNALHGLILLSFVFTKLTVCLWCKLMITIISWN